MVREYVYGWSGGSHRLSQLSRDTLLYHIALWSASMFIGGMKWVEFVAEEMVGWPFRSLVLSVLAELLGAVECDGEFIVCGSLHSFLDIELRIKTFEKSLSPSPSICEVLEASVYAMPASILNLLTWQNTSYMFASLHGCSI